MKVGDVPLWFHAVSCALSAGIRKIVIPTDDPGIPDQPLAEQVIVDRMPERYGADDNRVEDTCRYCLLKYGEGFETLVMLNPTHPLRSYRDVRACIDDVEVRGFPSSTLVRRDYGYTLPEGAALRTMNRQARVPRLVVTGECYAVRIPAFLEFDSLMIYGRINRGTQRISSAPHVDIDDADGLAAAEAVFRRHERKA